MEPVIAGLGDVPIPDEERQRLLRQLPAVASPSRVSGPAGERAPVEIAGPSGPPPRIGRATAPFIGPPTELQMHSGPPGIPPPAPMSGEEQGQRLASLGKLTPEMAGPNVSKIPPVHLPGIELPGQGQAAADRAELERLTKTGSGIDQVSRKHRFLGGFLRALETPFAAFLPGLDLAIPGTEGHHNLLVNRARGAVAESEANLEKQAQQGLTEAQTAEAQERTREQPELTELKRAAGEAKQQKDLHTYMTALRKQGMMLDDQGNPVPITYEHMSPTEQAAFDLKKAQQDATVAKAELDRAKNDPNSSAYQAALGRLQVARQNAATASGRLGLENQKFIADYFGTDLHGNALPGVSTDESGAPVGPRISNANNAPSERLRRGDLAVNARENIASLKEIIQRHPTEFGSVLGRITTVQQMMGSNDPDIARIGVTIHNLALASNGAHGIRSAEGVKDTEDTLLNHFKTGPQALTAALNELDRSLGTFIEAAHSGKKPQGEVPKKQAGSQGGNQLPGTGKTLTQAQIEQAAKDNHTTVELTIKAAKKQGYEVK
jgi:hypothetical protein